MSTTNHTNGVSNSEIRGVIEKLINMDTDILTIEEIDQILELLEKTNAHNEMK